MLLPGGFAIRRAEAEGRDGTGRAGRCERGKQLTVDINISLGKLLTLAQIEADETRGALFEQRSVCSWMGIELFYDTASQSLSVCFTSAASH